MTNIGELGITLGDLDFGGIDAESDTGLERHFVTTPYVESALEGKRRHFLGRKGSGKSALFSQIPQLVADSNRPETLVLSLTPNQYAWGALRDYRDQGILEEQAHTDAWKFTLAVEIAGALLAADVTWTPGAANSLARVRKFLTDNYGSVNPGLLGTAKSIVKGLTTFNLSAFGFGVGATRKIDDNQPLTPAISSQLMSELATAIHEEGLIVAIDRLDDSWDGSPASASLMVGLLKASKDLNDEFPKSGDNRGLRILTFIRSDIYDSLKFDDKDKHRSLEEPIQWTPELLKEMVDRRLPHNLEAGDLFEEGDMRGRISPFNYLVKRTFLRPREVLQFLDECIRVAGTKAPEISKDNISTAEDRYSSWKVSDLKQEYSKAFPDFEPLIESLRQEVHRYESLDDLASLLERKVPDLVGKYGTRSLLEKLFEFSVIGVRLADAGSTRFKAEDSSLTLPSSGAAYVHQSLFRGLSIRETRRAAEAVN
ncbi:hypothetical protein NFC73_18575 [Pseudarthrobacter sp. RMG13]|uniref:ATP-binding protein n=1 Tax=Pseudarthrobacter humi TaxID=2952523 RepID=A0ABT1LUN1_9MICC|nr:hypothetical protein [Pseudarthrobacter humi]MCP9001716.1 hypothetical protein [Pseudarthrobacter humi]